MSCSHNFFHCDETPPRRLTVSREYPFSMYLPLRLFTHQVVFLFSWQVYSHPSRVNRQAYNYKLLLLNRSTSVNFFFNLVFYDPSEVESCFILCYPYPFKKFNIRHILGKSFLLTDHKCHSTDPQKREGGEYLWIQRDECKKDKFCSDHAVPNTLRCFKGRKPATVAPSA